MKKKKNTTEKEGGSVVFFLPAGEGSFFVCGFVWEMV